MSMFHRKKSVPFTDTHLALERDSSIASGFTVARRVIELSEAEKAELRARISVCIRSQQQEERGAFALIPFLYRLRFAAGGLFGLVFAAGGIVYGAEGALPGDVLYPVKVEVNERLRGYAAVSNEAQAEWSVARATRRLQELEQLVASGQLNEERRREVTARFEEQATQANTAIARLKTEQISVAANTSSQLESSLRVHERTLMQVAEDRADVSSQLQVILETVRKRAASVTEIRQEIEKEIADAQEPTIPPEETTPADIGEDDGTALDAEPESGVVEEPHVGNEEEQKTQEAATTTPSL